MSSAVNKVNLVRSNDSFIFLLSHPNEENGNFFGGVNMNSGSQRRKVNFAELFLSEVNDKTIKIKPPRQTSSKAQTSLVIN